MKWILTYLKGTSTSCLCFGRSDLVLQGYTDVDYTSDNGRRKSTSGHLRTYAGGQCHDHLDCRNVFLHQLHKLST